MVDNNALGPNCVTEAKINGKSISNLSIVNGTLTPELFGVGSVDNNALGGNSVGNGEVQDVVRDERCDTMIEGRDNASAQTGRNGRCLSLYLN